MTLSVELGAADMLALIQASPSAGLLLPLASARKASAPHDEVLRRFGEDDPPALMERELGKEPRVAREVEEVAQDIRKELARMREGEPSAPRREGAADEE